VRTGNDLVQQLGEGVTFYSGMQEHVNKLKQMCSDYVMARNLDQERRMLDAKRQKDNAENEQAARRFQQMDISATGASKTNTAPPVAMQAPYAPAPPAPHTAHYMYPQHSAPAPPGASSPFSMYPAAPPPMQGVPDYPLPQMQSYQQPPPYGASPGQPPPGQYHQPGQYYQPQTYPQPPPPR
jgi:programmed cell death 6-interacting protein